jgi:hypothetical protein
MRIYTRIDFDDFYSYSAYVFWVMYDVWLFAMSPAEYRRSKCPFPRK